MIAKADYDNDEFSTVKISSSHEPELMRRLKWPAVEGKRDADVGDAGFAISVYK